MEDTPTGVELIAAERERQMRLKGWTAQHDREHSKAELACAAICYAEEAAHQVCQGHSRGYFPGGWPFENEAWQPSEDPIRNLVKAGALIAAEIDRLSAHD